MRDFQERDTRPDPKDELRDRLKAEDDRYKESNCILKAAGLQDEYFAPPTDKEMFDQFISMWNCKAVARDLVLRWYAKDENPLIQNFIKGLTKCKK